jgi:hypothetical protein
MADRPPVGGPGRIVSEPRKVHLVGSVPLADAQDVFSTVSAALGDRLPRIPDGETGPRSDWISWLEPVFSHNPLLQPSGKLFRVHERAPGRVRYTLRPGASVDQIRFDNLYYADIARESYAVFKMLKNDGVVQAGARFQVDLAPAHSVLWLFVEDELHAQLDPVYNQALMREIDRVAEAIPHDELAIQIDVASAVFARLQRGDQSTYGTSRDEMLASFSRIVVSLANRVPADVDLLFHLCYGDAGHRHVVEPHDMADMVEFTTRALGELQRPLNLVHMPVPRDRRDAAYFEPLRRLALPDETGLCLGLVHYTDGVEGARIRLASARSHVEDFAIATECGFGRRDPATIPELLRIHRAVSEIA